MKDIENILVRIANSRPQWSNLVIAVDSRVEKILSVLRPQALADHRGLLNSLGWPPSLSKSGIEKEKSPEIPNPLVLMQGEQKEKYSQSFIALCALQQLQAQREERRIESSTAWKDNSSDSMDMNERTSSRCRILAVDELVQPIASKMEYHFSRWHDQPRFIFALVYKVTRDFSDAIDNVLQPLIDHARLAGFSAKEAWVSAMSRALSEYLCRKIFPKFSESSGKDGSFSWLPLVDVIIAFDKQMRILSCSGNPNPHGTILGEVGRFSSSLSVMSIFSEHRNWLNQWAAMEIQEASDKLRSKIEDKDWLVGGVKLSYSLLEEKDDMFLLSTCDDYKAPSVADFVIKLAWAMIERAIALPIMSTRIQFMRSTATVFLSRFYSILLETCEDSESASSFVCDDEKLHRIIGSLNAARYCESVMRDWGEDLAFLEMSAAEGCCPETKGELEHPHGFFEAEVCYLVMFETDRLVAIMSDVLLKFEDLSWEYIQSRDQWSIEFSENVNDDVIVISPELVEALDMLNDRISFLRLHLNSKDFLDIWRSIADALDNFFFASIFVGDPHFSPLGANRLKADMGTLFLVFRSLCARPEAFFPRVCEALRLLALRSTGEA